MHLHSAVEVWPIDVTSAVEIWPIDVTSLARSDCHLLLQISETKWPEVKQLEAMLHDTCGQQLTWTSMPVELSSLFVQRFLNYYNAFVIGSIQTLGRVLHAVIRFEEQKRGSLHTHVLYWVHPDDVERVSREISAAIPADFSAPAESLASLRIPEDESEQWLLEQNLSKQQHVCRYFVALHQHVCR